MDKQGYYLTTAIAYTSGKPHIGNVYEIVLADAIARMKRLQGKKVYFQTGTDEHGEKNETRAKEQGMTPKAFVDGIADEIKRQWDIMNTSYDKFIRTTDEYHMEEVQRMFKRMYDNGDIYKGEYAGMYCTPCESFFTESQLKDGCCPDCGRKVSPAKEEAYFFKMSKYADRLIKHIHENPDFILPESRKNEMMNNFLIPGLQDLCVSRTSFQWGIPVDFDPGHVVYVWLDALTNYITGIGYHCNGTSEPQFDDLWPADLHLIGKDIMRFHAIYWPIFLMALDLPLPKHVFGHPWLLMDNDKMSKSKGNVIYADDLVSVFGVDAVRYYILREMPYDHDGNLSWSLVTERANADLANTLGNLVNRTVAMSGKYFGGAVRNAKCKEDIDDDFLATAQACRDIVSGKMEAFRVADALAAVMNLFRRANKYIDETTPWILAKDEEKQDRLQTVLYHLLDAIYTGAVLIQPFLPETSRKILAQINAPMLSFEQLGQVGNYPDGGKVTDAPEILFTRLDPEAVLEQAKALQEGDVDEITLKQREDIHGVAKIGIEDFAKVDLRVAKIIQCVPVKRAKKLLQLTLDDGTGIERTVVSGIAQWYQPEDLIGKSIVCVSNLKPATLCGVESQGMILAADGVDGAVCVLFVDGVPAGSKVR